MTRNGIPEDGERGESLDPGLAARLAGLPRELSPGRDLWPEIAARIGQPAPQALPPALLSPPAARPLLRRPAFWRQLAAALLSAALGAGATWLALGGRAPGVPAEAPAGPAARILPASYSAGADPAADPAAADYRLIEADYLRAKEALWISVYSRRERLSPTTLQAVEKNLAIIDQAIGDLRQALAADPGNPRLEEELYRNHRRGLDLLRRLAKSA